MIGWGWAQREPVPPSVQGRPLCAVLKKGRHSDSPLEGSDHSKATGMNRAGYNRNRIPTVVCRDRKPT
jgi:hypothetical protein